MPRCSFKTLIPLLSIYFVISIYALYHLLTNSRTEFHAESKKSVSLDDKSATEYKVEIWSKAAIGLYLWEHVFNEKLFSTLHGAWHSGKVKFGKITFLFKTGPAVVPSKLSRDLEYLVLVLNGRDDSKVSYAKQWLDFVHGLPNLKKLAVLLLGNEMCENEWILKYLLQNGGRIDCLFLVYDDAIIDDQAIFQWPLGVATYRNFKKYELSTDKLNLPRANVCNFFGTVYKNSSRESLINILHNDEQLKGLCQMKLRHTWAPQETKETLREYIEVLQHSDLTLNPAGKHNECYRIYEALALGSVPVIEDRSTYSSCDQHSFRILKSYNDSPFIFVKDWSEIHAILKNELSIPQWKKIARRNDLVRWYKKFLADMKFKFVTAINKTFF